MVNITPDPTARLEGAALAAVIESIGDLDPRLVRAEIAMRLMRVAMGNLAGTEYVGVFRLLDTAKSVLGPATNGVNVAGVAYAVEYVERVLDTLTEKKD